MTALADLLQPQTVTQIFQILLGVYQAAGFPVQSWQPFGTERTRLMAIATAVHDLSANYVPTLAAGGFTGTATGEWLRLLAAQLYAIDYNPASFTVGNITLTNASSSPYTIAAGDLKATFGASGRSYINNEGGTLPASDDLVLSFTAEFAGQAYSDPSSSGALTLTTPLPGVTLTNPAGDYSSVEQVGAGTGTVTPSGTPVGPHQVIVQIDSSGAAGAAAWSYSLDGAPFVSVGSSASESDLGGTGIDATLVDGPSGTSFVIGDTYLFTTPGTWITAQGADIESDASLALRCNNRWATLSAIPTNGYYELLVQSVPDVGSQVTQVVVLPDSVINNKVNIVVAGPLGVLPGATITDIQDYVTARTVGTDWATVVSPTTLAITVAATVTATASLLIAAQSLIDDAVTAYILGIGINGTIRIAGLIDVIMSVAGVVDVTSVTINGAAANLTLGSDTVFVVAELEPLDIAYVAAAA